MKKEYIRPLLLVLACALIAVVYLPGISGPFIFDDFNSIVLNEGLRVDELSISSIKQLLMSGNPGVFGRPISMVSFGLNYYFAGSIDTQAIKLTNIGVHLFAFIGVYGFVYSLLGVYSKQKILQQKDTVLLGLLVALLWALSPLQVSSVLYSVQRMAMLSAAFSFYALWTYIEWRRDRLSLLPAAGLFLAFSVLAFLSKENAILIAVFILLIEYCFFNDDGRDGDGIDDIVVEKRASFWKVYRQVLFISAVIGIVTVFGYLQFYVDWFSDGYLVRDFSQSERILTQFRVLLAYPQWIIYPDIDQYGFFHDDIPLSLGWLQPLTTLISAIVLAFLLIVLWCCRAKAPWALFGFAWYLVGHSLESTFIPLELVFEHRNYLPSFGIIFITVLTVHTFVTRFSNYRFFILLSIIWITFYSSMTMLRSAEWGSAHTQFSASAERRPNSPRAQWELARWYLSEYRKGLMAGKESPMFYQQGVLFAERSMNADSRSSLAPLSMIAFQCESNMAIDQKWADEAIHRLRFPYRVENHAPMKAISDCAIDKMDSKSISSLVDALFLTAIDSGKMGDKLRSELQYVYGMFLYSGGNIEGAVRLFERSLRLYERNNTYARLIIHSLEMKNREKAQSFLAGLKQMLGSDYESSSLYQNLEEHIALCCDRGASFKLTVPYE